MGLNLTLLDAFCVCLAVYLISKLRTRNARGMAPPGPSPLPLVGNLLDMPTSHEWLKFADWGQTYGDVVSVTVPGQRLVILNSHRTAVDLLDKRSSIYSNRPDLLVAGRIVGWNETLVLTPYGERFHTMRRQSHQFMGSRRHMVKFRGMQVQEAYRFLRRLLHDPTRFADHIRKNAGAVILKMAYNYEVKEEHDELVEVVDRALEGFIAATTPGAFLADLFPILRFVPSWVPGTGWKRKAQAWHGLFRQMSDIPYNMAKSNPVESSGMPCFVQQTLGSAGRKPVNEDYVKMSAASLYSGGADTTVSAILTFFLAMTLFPDIQEKAQVEIDSVIGPDRLPTFEDWDRLPYVNALCSEILRWQPVAPLCLIHTSTEDDLYDGYFIPKGTFVIANIWAILHDPRTYSDPESFKPERYLSVNGSVPEPNPRAAMFGFGRRICPGMHLAETSIFLSCAMTLAAFNISKVIKDGREVTPLVEYRSGTISRPKPFKCTITPRSARAEALVLAQDEP